MISNYLFLLIDVIGLFAVCLARIVDSVATAQSLKGCTVIQGILEIQIRGGSKFIHFRVM